MQIDNFAAHYAIEICLWLEAQIRFDNCNIKQIDLKEKIARKHDTLQLRLMSSTIMSYVIKKRFGLFDTGNCIRNYNNYNNNKNEQLALGTVLASKIIDENGSLIDKHENINVDVFPSVNSIIKQSQTTNGSNKKPMILHMHAFFENGANIVNYVCMNKKMGDGCLVLIVIACFCLFAILSLFFVFFRW